MKNTHEKRRTSRYPIDAPLLCSYFNKSASACAKATNFSQDGMFFVTDMEFYPGSALLIRAKNDGTRLKMPEKTEGLRQTTLAEVRWCKRISEEPTHYQVGVKYYESWY